jgi:D-amino-acid dehydrogenase
MNSNMMPIVQKSKSNDNVFYNGGHGHLGWTLGAVTGKMVADLI